jgi:eukaryotic-like serine/threonine-protein kinase
VTHERWQLAYAIFEAAAPLAEPQRRQYVDATAPDAEIAGKILTMLDEMEDPADSDNSSEPAYFPDAAPPLAPGSRLGPYEILKRIAGGGMGVVYRARDPRLDRQIAIKLLRPDMAADPRAHERLQREAKAAAALDHPYICKVFEIGEYGGTLFLAMEYIAGQTLHDRLLNGPMPLADILPVAGEIAEALQEAHSRRFLHRDLKPANIMLTEQGHVKILDFGLARQLADRPTTDPFTASLERRGSRLTVPGTVIGTPDYMSPEQARGEELDVRTDLFSFGCVLYEMATGRRAFSGFTTALIFNSIVHAAPASPLLLNAALPSKLEEIIGKALEKDRELRYQHAADMRADLKRLARDTNLGSSPVTPLIASSLPNAQAVLDARARRSPTPRWLRVVAALVILIAGSASVWFATHRVSPPQPEPKPRRLTANPIGNPAMNGYISPDGKYLAYGDQGGIHIQLIDGGVTRTIPQPEGLGYKITGWFPIGWFPDGTKFLAQATSLGAENSGVWVASVLGGTPRQIREGALAWSVSPDGSLIAFSSNAFNSDIWVMGASGEDPRKIVSAEQGESFVGVVWSPDNQRIAYGRLRSGPAGTLCDIANRDLKSGQPVIIVSDPKVAAGFGGNFWWLADGRLVYSLSDAAPVFGPGLTDMNLWEIKVDLRNGKPAGEPRQMTNWTDFSLSTPNATANGKRLVFGRIKGQTDVYIGDLGPGGNRLKSAPRRLTLDERNDEPTAWMPDNKSVLFQSDRSGNYDIYKQPFDRHSPEPVVATPQTDIIPRLSADGRWIVFASLAKPDSVGPGAPLQLRRVPVSGGASQFVLTAHGYSGHRCALAPATLCLLGEHSSDQTQLIFTAFDPVKGRGREMVRVATNPGSRYNWDLSPDGSQLALSFPAGENRIRLLPLAGGAPRDLVVNGRFGLDSGPDWSPGGKGFYASSLSPTAVTLLYIDLNGDAHALWEQKGGLHAWGIPSFDGRHLAMLVYTMDSNIWMLENF